jgi:broad specificity phosphatase PhoE
VSSPSASTVFCRHGATEHNVTKRFLSVTDLPLGPLGRAQCRSLREALKLYAFERCLVSPMRRCLETRAIVAPEIPFAVDPALREVHFGNWEGRTLGWVESNAPELLAQRRRDPVRFRPPGGESFEDAAVRLRELAASIRDGGATLVIGHRVTLGILERLVRGLPLDSPEVMPLEPAEFRIVSG